MGYAAFFLPVFYRSYIDRQALMLERLTCNREAALTGWKNGKPPNRAAPLHT